MKTLEQVAMAVVFGFALLPAVASVVLALWLRRRATRNKSSLSAIGKTLLFVVMSASLLPALVFIVYVFEPRGVMVYDDLQLSGSGRFLGGGAYDRLVVGTSSTSLWALSDDRLAPNDLIRIPDIYIRLPDGRSMLLHDITPQVASLYWERLGPRETARYPRVSFHGHYSTPLECSLVFDGDRLIAAELNGRAIMVGRRPDGPFHSMPLSYRQMVELFGQPRSIIQRHWAI